MLVWVGCTEKFPTDLMVQEVAVKAVMDSILLRACLAGICYLDGTDGFMGFLGGGGGYLRVLENF